MFLIMEIQQGYFVDAEREIERQGSISIIEGMDKLYKERKLICCTGDKLI